jgi:hypothetical protein
MMISIFTCATKDCIYNLNPVRMVDPTNPVMCGACFCYGNAVTTDEELPTAPAE